MVTSPDNDVRVAAVTGSATRSRRSSPSASNNVREVSEPKGLEHVRLHRRSLCIHGVRAEGRAHYGARRSRTLGLRYELADGFGDIVRIRCTRGLKHAHEMPEHCGWNVANGPVAAGASDVGRLERIAVHGGGIRARLQECD